METLVVGLVSLLAGAGIKTWFDRFQATWLKRRDVAAEAYGAVVAMHSAVVSAVAFARRVDARIRADLDQLRYHAETSDWHFDGFLEASSTRLAKLREARINMRSIWGESVATMFDDFFELTSAWQAALGTYHLAIRGHSDPYEGEWDEDVTGFHWPHVIEGKAPHAEAFDRELEHLMDIIRRFARSAGVAITDTMELPQGVREVVAEYEDHRARRPLALPPPPQDPQR